MSRPQARPDLPGPVIPTVATGAARQSTPRLWLHAALALAVCCLALLMLRLLAPGEFRTSFTREPSPYTALAFVAPDELVNAPADLPRMSLAFRVTNSEGREQVYRYLVTVTSAGRDRFIAAGDLPVASGASAVETVHIENLPLRQAYRIVVALPENSETISLLRS
jgi:hypothetical protein